MSSEIENIFTTDDESYKAYSDNTPDQSGESKEVLRYREALWSGHHHVRRNEALNIDVYDEGDSICRILERLEVLKGSLDSTEKSKLTRTTKGGIKSLEVTKNIVKVKIV